MPTAVAALLLALPFALTFTSACSSDDAIVDGGASDAATADADTAMDAEADTGTDSETDASAPPEGDPPDGGVTSTDAALPGVFIPPFVDCRDPLPGEPEGTAAGGQVCTNVAISGATEEGRYFPDYGSCEVVRTQRPFWERPHASESDANDPRLDDDEFLAELAWAQSQIEATGCACCHDSRQNDGKVGQWDIAYEPIWLDTLSDTGLALFGGYADSSVLGAYPAVDNHGFDRTATGIPTTDTRRMRAFVDAELMRRGISKGEARMVPPFGGPIYTNQVAVPERCGAGEGIAPDGVMHWTGGPARYIYVLEEDTKNPGVPPNLDTPVGTLYRLDVLPSEAALVSGVEYDTTPDGAWQNVPASGAVPALEEGTTYHFVVLLDVGVPIANCLFTFGDAVEPQAPGDGGASEPCTDEETGFGAACTTDADCEGCASYCALMPGASAGYCTFTGCLENPDVCPADSAGCFDVSIFQAGAPSICLQPAP